MKNVVFVGYEDDRAAVQALDMIKQFGKDVCVLERGAHASSGTTVLFSTAGDLRGRYIRIFPKNSDRATVESKTYKILVPSWASGADVHVALDAESVDLKGDELARFTECLMQVTGCHAAGVRPKDRPCSKRVRTGRGRRSLSRDEIIGGH